MDAKVRDEIRSELPPGFSIDFAETADRREHLAMIADADFILTSVPVDAEMIRAAPRLKLLHKWGIGVDKFDLDAARAAGVPVAITFGANAGAVSEHVLMLMLATYRRLALADRKLRDGVWLRPQLRAQCYQISGKTVGLLGFGNVGRMVAHRLAGFEVEIIYQRHPPRRHGDREGAACHAGAVRRAARTQRRAVGARAADAGDQGMIGAETIARMKTGAVSSTPRAAASSMRRRCMTRWSSGKLHGAGLDVFAMEPADPANPLFRLDQVVVTPHTAGSVIDLVADIARHAFTNMQTVLRGEPLSPDDVVVAAEGEE